MLNPYRPYRPSTCSGKRLPPTFLSKRRNLSFWQGWKLKLAARKAVQKEKREKRGYALRGSHA